MRDCEICGGEGVVRLAKRYRMASLPLTMEPPKMVEQSWGSYPCPECKLVALERVSVVTSVKAFDADAPVEYAEKYAAHAIAAHLRDGGFIKTKEGPVDTYRMTRPVLYTVGVVSAAAVSKIEDRIAKRQMEVAKEVVDGALLNIRCWGERTAATAINAAFNVVKASRANFALDGDGGLL